MAGVTGIFWFFPGGAAKFGDWTTFYFLCLQDLAPGLEHRSPSKSVCGCTGSKEGCRQCVCSPQIVMRVGLLLTAAMSSLFRNRPSTPWSDSWDSRLAACGFSSLPCGRPFLHLRPLNKAPFQWPQTSLSPGHGRRAVGWEKEQGLLLTRVRRCPSVTDEG